MIDWIITCALGTILHVKDSKRKRRWLLCKYIYMKNKKKKFFKRTIRFVGELVPSISSLTLPPSPQFLTFFFIFIFLHQSSIKTEALSRECICNYFGALFGATLSVQIKKCNVFSQAFFFFFFYTTFMKWVAEAAVRCDY